MLDHCALQHLVLLGHIHNLLGHFTIDRGATEWSQTILLLHHILPWSVVPQFLSFLLILHLLYLFYCWFNSFILHLPLSSLFRRSWTCLRLTMRHHGAPCTKVILGLSHLRLFGLNCSEVETFLLWSLMEHFSGLYTSRSVTAQDCGSSHLHLWDSCHLLSDNFLLSCTDGLRFKFSKLLLLVNYTLNGSSSAGRLIIGGLCFELHLLLKLWDSFLQSFSDWSSLFWSRTFNFRRFSSWLWRLASSRALRTFRFGFHLVDGFRALDTSRSKNIMNGFIISRIYLIIH